MEIHAKITISNADTKVDHLRACHQVIRYIEGLLTNVENKRSKVETLRKSAQKALKTSPIERA